MKKSKVFMAAGGLVLSIAGVLATKASKKFTSPTSAVFLFTGMYTTPLVIMSLPGGSFTTTSSMFNAQVYIGLYTHSFSVVSTVLVGRPILSSTSLLPIYK